VASLTQTGVVTFDMAPGKTTLREFNHFLHHEAVKQGVRKVEVIHPDGLHNLAVGVDAPIDIDIRGHAGYFIGGMNKQANITVHGSVGWSVAENIMSGSVRVKGNASECAAGSGHGGLVVIEGDASSRCGISMKGVDIVVGGSVGHMSAFMAQAGTLVICEDSAAALGDSLYEAVIYVRGKIASLGADAREEAMAPADHAKLQDLLGRAGINYAPKEFQRIASARTLYHWNSEHSDSY
jgi:methylamine---glutamate N-methyltransferase subunit B